MSRKMKAAIVLAYIPTLIVLLIVLLLTVMYLRGWRVLVYPEPPTETPFPMWEAAKDSFPWN